MLLLRTVIGLSAAAEALSLLKSGAAGPLSIGVSILLAAGSLSALAGFLTPIAALLIAACAVALGLEQVPTSAPDILNDRVATFLVASTSIALALLGPGAYSFDSYLFGRREIVIKRSI